MLGWEGVEGGGSEPGGSPIREEEGLTVRAGISRMYSNQALGVSRALCERAASSQPGPLQWPPLALPPFLRAPPIWAACLPQPEQSFQTINQITLLPTPLPPHLPIRSRRKAKAGLSLGPQCSLQGWGLGENRFLQSHLPSPHPPSPLCPSQPFPPTKDSSLGSFSLLKSQLW